MDVQLYVRTYVQSAHTRTHARTHPSARHAFNVGNDVCLDYSRSIGWKMDAMMVRCQMANNRYVFASLNPALGYVQGMHDIACAIYFQFHCEHRRVATPAARSRVRGAGVKGPIAPDHHQPSLAFVDSPRRRTDSDWRSSVDGVGHIESGRSARRSQARRGGDVTAADSSSSDAGSGEKDKDRQQPQRRSATTSVPAAASRGQSFVSPLFPVASSPDAVEAATFSVLNAVVGRCYLMKNLFQSKRYVDEVVRVFSAVLVRV